MHRKTRTVLTPEGRLLKLRPIFKLSLSYVVCLPPQWADLWLNAESMWAVEEETDNGRGIILRPYLDQVPEVVHTLPLGI